MQLSAINSLIPLAGDLTLAEKGIASAKVILTGFVVVFAVLLLLIFIIKIYSAIVGKAQGTGKKTKKNKKVDEPSKPSPAVSAVQTPVAAESAEAQDGIPEEVIAVISAAVAAVYGNDKKVRIKSVKKSGSRRTAWANAGVLENTRPF